MIDLKKLCIKKLNLHPHPEGGYFRETFRSKEIIKKENLPGRYSGDRSLFTSILFMIDGKNFSSFHRLKTDELWYYNFGNSLLVTTIDEYGNLSEIILGGSFDDEEKLQHLVPAGSWMSASVEDKFGFSVVSCSMSPGFDYDDFELADRKKLIELFPNHRVIIEKYTR